MLKVCLQDQPPGDNPEKNTIKTQIADLYLQVSVLYLKNIPKSGNYKIVNL